MRIFLKPFVRPAQAIFALFLAYFAIRLFIYHYCMVTFPYPITFREGAMMTSTVAMVHGLNPYAMAIQPRFMNQYGIIYPLLAWPFAMIFGTTMVIHRMVTAFSILASCSLIFMVLKKITVPLLVNIWAVLMLYASLLYPATSTPAVDPAATGMFFMLLSVFIPWFNKYSYTSLILSILFGLLAFYSKPYTLLGVPVMASYIFFFVSKTKGLTYTLVSLTLCLISIFVVNRALPAYFDNCFFTSWNMTSNWLSMDRLRMQVQMYSQIHLWTLVLTGAFAAYYGVKSIKAVSNHQRSACFSNFMKLWRFSPKDPLIDFDFPLVLYAGLCASFVLYISLGRHTGATLWYFFQLLSPFFLVSAAWLFSRTGLWPLLCVPFLVLNLFTITTGEVNKFFDKDVPGWSDISRLLNGHDRILNSCLIAPMLIEQNKEFYDDGQTEYFLIGAKRQGIFGRFMKEDQRIYYQGVMFFEDIRNKLENKMFDLVMLQPNLLPGGIAEDVRKYYKYEGQIVVYASQDRRPYTITVWKPI